MFKLSLSLKIAVMTLLANNIYVLHGMDVEEERKVTSQENLIALYKQIVDQQKEFPGHGYDEKDLMYKTLLASLKDVQNSGMSEPCQKMWLIPPDIFSKLFSPHNIQMLAYQQNQFGNGDPYTFIGFNRNNPYDYRVQGISPEEYFPSITTEDNPFLVSYGDEQRRTLLITYYSYFFGMLENINKANNTLGPLSNFTANFARLHTNLIAAKNHYLDLSAHAIGQIAEAVTKEGDMRFLQLIKDATGFAYRRNELEDSSDNIGKVVSQIRKNQLLTQQQPTAIIPPPVPLTAAQKPKTIVPPSGMTWWQKLAAATGVTAAIGALYYNYLKTPPTSK